MELNWIYPEIDIFLWYISLDIFKHGVLIAEKQQQKADYNSDINVNYVLHCQWRNNYGMFIVTNSIIGQVREYKIDASHGLYLYWSFVRGIFSHRWIL